MSMSKKLYLILGMLIAIAMVITVVSVGGILQINDTAAQMGRLASRSLNLNVIDKISQERSNILLRIIDTTSLERIKELTDINMAKTEEDMKTELADYQGNFPENPTEEMKMRPVKIAEMWDEFVKVTYEIVEMASINSNVKAFDMAASTRPFWIEMETRLSDIIKGIPSDADPGVLAWINDLYQARIHVGYYRYNLVQVVGASTAEQAQSFEAETRRRMDEIVASAKKGEGLPSPYREKAKAVVDDLEKTAIPMMNEIIRWGLINSNAESARLFATRAEPIYRRLTEYTDVLIAESKGSQKEALANMLSLGRAVMWLAVTVSLVGIALGSFLAWLTVSRLIRKIDEIIKGLRETSEEVSTASQQISGASQSLAEGATEQAASLEETSSALEQMASMTRQNADNAGKTNSTSVSNNKTIGAGAVAVNNMSEAMSEINNSAEKISLIIKTIEDIAFQTNLLALNAAVEAARAGEAGKGFAVVADEVRNLAQRSAQAARDTTQLIESTVTRVKNGSEIVQELARSFKEIEEGSGTVSRLVSEIASATDEQAQGVDQVNTAVAQMDKVTQQNAANAEQSASAATMLSDQAEHLNGMVGGLVMLVRGTLELGANGNGNGRGRNGNGRRKASGGGMKVVKVNDISDAGKEEPSSGKRVLVASEVIPLSDDDAF